MKQHNNYIIDQEYITKKKERNFSINLIKFLV